MPTVEPPLNLGIEVDEASQAFSIETSMPQHFSVEFMSIVGIGFRNNILRKQASAEFAELSKRLTESISNEAIGYLLEVGIFVNEFGHIVVPSGQLLYPIGLGVEPVDAFAEHLRNTQLRPGTPIPVHLKNETFYMWVTRSGPSLKVRTIPKEFRSSFLENSRKEANRREYLEGWIQALPSDPHKSIIRSQYWADVEKSRLQLVRDQEKQKTIVELGKQMAALEAEVNHLYYMYQDISMRLAHQERYYSTLGTISSLTSIFQSAIELGKIFDNTSKNPIKGTGTPSADIPATVVLTEKQIVEGSGYRKELGKSIRVEAANMELIDKALREMYRGSNIPLPHTRPEPIIDLEAP